MPIEPVMEIRPWHGVGPLNFGISREEVRAIMGPPSSSFLKGSDVDDFNGAHVFLDPLGKFEAMETWQPRKLFLSGVDLLSLPFHRLREFLSNLDKLCAEADAGLDCPGIGVRVYCPKFQDSPESTAEAILCHSREYLNRSFDLDEYVRSLGLNFDDLEEGLDDDCRE
jgi:hypothetical protein